MKAVAITPVDIVAEEARSISTLLEEGWWRVHLRHPGASAEKCAEILKQLSPAERAKVSVHDHFSTLSRLFPEIGLHINSRQERAGASPCCGKVSRSCHDVAETLSFDGDYAMLSPIFDSVSKPGYKAAFSEGQLRRLEGRRNDLIALGGVTPDRLPLLAEYNFSGFAMLGAIPWQTPEEIKTFSKKIFSIC